MVIDFAKLPNPAKERPTLILRNLSGNAIQPLGYAFNIKAELAYNEVSTLSFDLPSSVDGVDVPNYDAVVGMRQVDLLGNDGAPCARFILIDPQEKDDGVRRVKSCKAYSLEYEFAKKDFFLDAGTYNFFTLGDETTIVKLVLDEVPGWSIGSVSSTLIGRYRTFDEQKCKAYDFIKNQAQEKYGCIFEFDTVNRQVNIIDVMEDRSATDKRRVFLSPERLIKEIDINEDSDKIVTALDVSGADGVTIRSVNPTGTNTIYNLDYFMNETNFPGGSAPTGIITKWNAWKAAVAAAQSDYYDITIQYNMKLLQTMMKQAELDGLKTDLLVLENEQAVIIQAIQQKLKTQADLNNVNTRIAAKQTEITAKQAEVDAMQAVADGLHNQLVAINQSLDWENPTGDPSWKFTHAEVVALQRYCFEDSIQDGTFVAETAKVYVNQDLQSAVSNASLAITDGAVTEPATQLDHTVYSCRGGSLSFSFATTTGTMSFSGYVVSATVDDDANGDTVLTAYLRSGSIIDTPSDVNETPIVTIYESATITIAGTAGTITSSSTGLSFTVTSGSFYFTENTTEYEVHQIEYELYEYGTLVLQRKCNPTYNFTVNSGNFLIMDDFVSFKNQLELGRKVYLQLEKDGIPLQPYVLSVTMDYEDFGSFTIKFSDAYTSFDNTFDLADLLSQSVSMGKTLSTKGNSYDLFVASGASTKVHDFMTSALDIATNAVLSTGMQAITMDDAGLRIRKWTDDTHTAYDSHQIWIVDNVMAFTKDGWNTSEMALGEIFDENLLSYIRTEDSSQVTGKTYYLDDQGTVWTGTPAWSTDLYERSYGYTITEDLSRDYSKTYYTDTNGTVWNGTNPAWGTAPLYEKSLGATAYGICAPYIVGTMIAGNNLVIESEKKDGGTSVFRVDGNGASLYNASFTVNNGTSEIMLDPVLGFGIGDVGIVKVVNGVRQWDDTKTKLWIDTSGNLHVKGTGEFSGALHVGETTYGGNTFFRFNVDADGNLTIKNAQGTTQMSADSTTGNLTFNGSYSGELHVGPISGTSNPVLYRFNVDGDGKITVRDAGGTSRLYFDTNGNLTFKGNLSAAGGTFSGAVSGGSLDIGPYTYGNSTYYHLKAESTGRLSIGTSATVGQTQYARYERFVVTNDGKLDCTDATVRGTITGSTVKASTLSSSSGGVTLDGYLTTTNGDTKHYVGYIPGTGKGFGMYTSTNDVYTSLVRCTDYGSEIAGGNANATQAAKIYVSCSGTRPVANMQITDPNASTSSSGQTKFVSFGYAGGWTFMPETTGLIDLGGTTYRWRTLFSTNNVDVGSDRRLKHDIEYDIDSYEAFFDNLYPVRYKLNCETSEKYHTGFIAQDVEAALSIAGLTPSDFAGYFISDADNDGERSLRYGEFIALNTMKIKKLEQRIAALEAQLAQ